MKKITESGWKKSDGENIKEEDIRALFDMIDTDRSGSLSKRVNSIYNIIHSLTSYLLGGQKSCKIDPGQIWF